MLPRHSRLTRKGFAGFAPRRRASGAHISLSFAPARHGAAGCAVIVSKKTARRAVDRVLLKRRLKSIVRAWCSPEYAFVVYARAGILALSYAELKKELEGLLRQAFGPVSGTI